MAKLKTFNVSYRCEVKRTATVEAQNMKDAIKKFNCGDFDDEQDVDCYDIDDVCIYEENCE